jgi:AcrR family transcriptional regulator
MGTTIRLPRAERRAQIATAAAAAFLRGGFDGTSMDDVAREAGVTRLIVYRVFDGKEVLYRAVLDLVLDDLDASFLRRAGDADPEPIAAVLLGVARRHPDAFRLLWRHAAHEAPFARFVREFRRAVNEYAEALLAPALAEPVVRGWAAEAVASHLYDGVCLWLDDGDPARDDVFVALLVAGSRAMVEGWREVAARAPGRGGR